MAALVLTDASVVIDSQDISTYVQSVTIPRGADIVDTTTMSSTSAKTNAGGLTEWSATIECRADFADNLLDEILYSRLAGSYTCVFKASSGSVTTSNPSYTGTGIIKGYSPISGNVGELAKVTIEIQGSGVLTRATS